MDNFELRQEEEESSGPEENLNSDAQTPYISDDGNS